MTETETTVTEPEARRNDAHRSICWQFNLLVIKLRPNDSDSTPGGRLSKVEKRVANKKKKYSHYKYTRRRIFCLNSWIIYLFRNNKIRSGRPGIFFLFSILLQSSSHQPSSICLPRQRFCHRVCHQIKVITEQNNDSKKYPKGGKQTNLLFHVANEMYLSSCIWFTGERFYLASGHASPV